MHEDRRDHAPGNGANEASDPGAMPALTWPPADRDRSSHLAHALAVRPARHEAPMTDAFVLEAELTGERVLVEVVARGDRRLDPETAGSASVQAGRLRGEFVAALHSVPALAQALQAGCTLRVVRDKRYREVMKGTKTLVRSGQHTFATTRGEHGHFAGHLRVHEPSKIVAGVAATFHIASAVTLQYYLHSINDHLATIETSIAGVVQSLQNDDYAELESAAREIRRVDALRRDGGSLADRDWERLQSCIDTTMQVMDASHRNLRPFLDEIEDVREAVAAVAGSHIHDARVIDVGGGVLASALKHVVRSGEVVADHAGRIARTHHARQAMSDVEEALPSAARELVLFLDACTLLADLFDRLLASERAEQLESARVHARDELGVVRSKLAHVADHLEFDELEGDAAALGDDRTGARLARLREVCERLAAPTREAERAISVLVDERPYVMELSRSDDDSILAVVTELPATPSWDVAELRAADGR